MRTFENKYDITIPINLGLTIINYNDKRITIIDGDDYYVTYESNTTTTNLIIYDDSHTINYSQKTYNNTKQIFLKIFNRYLESWENYFFQKIKFKGKGYRIRKHNKMIKFFFYFSHMNIVKVCGCKLKKIGKYKFILLSNDYEFLKKLALKISFIRNINKFTKRGLRLGKQVVHKRQGKKNAYVKQ